MGIDPHTARKYALSPGPHSGSRGGAYGGPHARVSSPRTGCSILITSALCTHITNVRTLDEYLAIGFIVYGMDMVYTLNLQEFGYNKATLQLEHVSPSLLASVSTCHLVLEPVPGLYTYPSEHPSHIYNSNTIKGKLGRIWWRRCCCCRRNPSCRAIPRYPRYKRGSCGDKHP